ncbi:MAG TPA: GIY-YIG nuclease family protein [Bauldia sp.]|nr:GIY-YIG nuclease family protein [Bauldia sp.]
MTEGAYVYILECCDGSFYVGSTRRETVEERLSEHQQGRIAGYTSARLPVRLVWAEHFPRIVDAIAFEQQVKRWSRAKKIALIRGEWDRLRELARRRSGR